MDPGDYRLEPPLDSLYRYVVHEVQRARSLGDERPFSLPSALVPPPPPSSLLFSILYHRWSRRQRRACPAEISTSAFCFWEFSGQNVKGLRKIFPLLYFYSSGTRVLKIFHERTSVNAKCETIKAPRDYGFFFAHFSFASSRKIVNTIVFFRLCVF